MSMYNKIFTKILDSSIWLEPDATRLVWMTLIAAMDEDGVCQFASVANLAHRARVTLEAASQAVVALEGPDENSSDPDNEGRRIERIPGGWIVLNAKKYRELVTRTVIKEQTRARVARHRSKRAGNAEKRHCNAEVTQSRADTDTESKAQNTDSSELCSKREEGVMTFKTVGGAKEWSLTKAKFDEYRESFPNLNIEQCLREARQWLIDSPAKRKTPQGMTKFLGGWLGRQQNRNGGDRHPVESRQTELHDYTEEFGPCQTEEVFATMRARLIANNPPPADHELPTL